MHINASCWPTQNADALLSFVEGRDLLRNYLGSGSGEDLARARSSFSEAERSDPEFALATFYLAVVDSELRNSDSAIARLESLTRRPIDFLPEAYLRLAYAHTKRYRDSDYFEAEAALDHALAVATARGRRNLIPLIEAYRTFLFSVMGGRLQQGARQPYIEKAIEAGTRLLQDPSLAELSADDRNQVLLEIHNALGISYMRRGQHEGNPDQQQRDWELAGRHYAEALKLSPNTTRVLENIGTHRMIEGDQLLCNGEREEAARLYRAAQELFRCSLDLNSRDQFPHYRMAELSARLGDWEAATLFYASGREQHGAVAEGNWERLHRAIESRDITGLLASE